MPLDADSLKYLEDVKRGKRRKFVMIMKGEKIINLILFKKGSLEKYRKEAKEEGAGQFYHGIVEGKGMNIAFKLSTEDGFTDPPGKDIKLKMYLSEQSGIRFKPSYEIVPLLPEVADDDEVETEEQTPSSEQSSTAVDDPAMAAKLTEALNKLTPLIKQALATAPDRKQDILQPAATIKGLIAGGEYSPARNQLLSYASLLKEIGGTPDASTSHDLLAIWRAAKESVDGQLEKFREALSKTGDPYLTKIATGGVDSFVAGPGREYVTLHTALEELRGADGPARKQLGQRVLSAVESYRRYIEANKFIEVCDTNKLCGPMSVRKTLGEALTKLEQSVATVVG